MSDEENPEKMAAKRPCFALDWTGSELPEGEGRTRVVHLNIAQCTSAVGPFGSLLAAAHFGPRHLEVGSLVLFRELILPDVADPHGVVFSKIRPLPWHVGLPG